MRFALYLLGLALLKGIFQYWMRVIIIGISRDIEYDLRNDLFRHLASLSPDYYGRTRTGDIMARATNDLNAVRMMLGPGVMYCFETGLTFMLAIGIMVSVDWRLAIPALLPAPAVSVAVILFGRAIHARFERIQAMFSDISSRVQENLSGVRMIRAFAQERAELRRFEELNRAVHRAEPEAGAHSGRLRAAARSADRPDLPGGALGGRLSGAEGPHLHRQLRHVQHLHGHAGLADDRARAGWST